MTASTVWRTRPREIAALFNPAFCALLLRDSVSGFHKESGTPMPYALAFIVLPLTLHKRTREQFPHSIATRIPMWLQDEQSVRIGLADRVASLVPYTREAMVFALSEPLVLLEGSSFKPSRRRQQRPDWPKTSEPFSCRTAATFLGRWMANSGEPGTIFSLLGIRP